MQKKAYLVSISEWSVLLPLRTPHPNHQTDDDQSLSESSAKLVDALVISVQRRQIVGSLNVALATGVLIQNVVRSIKYNSVEELIAAIKAIGRRLSRANPRGKLGNSCLDYSHAAWTGAYPRS